MIDTYSEVCGKAFEDLTTDELMEYDGGSAIPSFFLLSLVIGGGAGLSVTYIWR
ncbi:MAG: hypothetical protein LBG99_08080 [Propionibacteriaceae bacterium]|nr:hypothetical protein [Propionibacteriaceae bacterium]